MARQAEPQDVQITLADGKVLHFKPAFGDTIVLNEVNTYKKEVPPVSVHYYTLMITPSKSTEG